jgi:hypothetical protein
LALWQMQSLGSETGGRADANNMPHGACLMKYWVIGVTITALIMVLSVLFFLVGVWCLSIESTGQDECPVRVFADGARYMFPMQFWFTGAALIMVLIHWAMHKRFSASPAFRALGYAVPAFKVSGYAARVAASIMVLFSLFLLYANWIMLYHFNG